MNHQDDSGTNLFGQLQPFQQENSLTDKDGYSMAISNLKALLNVSPDIIVLVDQQGIILETSLILPAILKRNPAELVGTNIRQWIPPEARNNRLLVMDQVMRGGEPAYFEDRAGGRIWSNAVFPVYSSDGVLTNIALFGHDVTEARKAEESLRQAEEQFRNFYDNSPIGLYRTTPDGRIIMANRTICAMLGYEGFEQLANRNLKVSGFGELNDRTGFVSRIEQEGEIKDLEAIWERSDGTPITVRERAKAIRDSDGKTLYYDGYVEDISARKSAENALNRAEEKFQRMVANLNDVVYSVDGNTGEYTYLSPVFERMFGYTADDISNMGGRVAFLSRVLPQGEATMHQSRFEILKSQSTEGMFTYEYWCRCKDGSLKYISDHWTPVYQDVRLVSTDGVLRDITQRKLAEDALSEALVRAEASDRLKTAFMNNISHEVRTPLNGILGFADLLDVGDVSAEDKTFYREILHTSSDRLLKTINSYMDISLLVSGNMKTCLSRFDIHDVMKQIWQQYVDQAAGKGVTLRLTQSPNQPQIYVESDPALITKVLDHLLENAVKFTEFGLVEIGCKSLPDAVEVTVRDSGPGIDDQLKDQIFDSFLQADVSNTRRHEGSGLGLAIVKGLVELLGGRIWVQSIVGKGSTFGFTLPVNASRAICPESSVFTGAKAGGDAPVILIAEDDPINIFLLETMLGKTSAVVWHVENGSLAVDFCRHHPEVSLVLMDLKMPVMDGFEATRLIKSISADLPVLAVTAYAMPGDRVAALEAGCDGYMTKPFTSAELLENIRRFVDL